MQSQRFITPTSARAEPRLASTRVGMVNMVAGASHIRQSDFLVGTVIGMLPGIFLTTTFAEHLVMAIHRPSHQTLGILMIVVLLLIAVAIATANMIRRGQRYR